MPLTIYKSSAGSGKTYTLVLEYLKVVLANPNHYRNTLAVTFTNKATEEMKQRIVKAVVELCTGTNPKLHDQLAKELGDKIHIKKNATIVLENILHDYTSFSISTIDAFFIRIIKSMSHELGLPGKYEVDINQLGAIDEICNSLLSELGANEQLTQWLENFVFDKLDNDKGWHIQKELKKIAAELFKESYSQHGGHNHVITKENVDEVKTIKNVFENFVKTHAQKCLDLIKSCGLHPYDFAYGDKGFGNYFLKVLDKPAAKDFFPGTRFISASQSAETWFSKSSEKRKSMSAAFSEKLLSEMHLIVKYTEQNARKYFTAIVVSDLMYVAGITSYLEQQLKNYRDKYSLFLLSDAQKFLSNVLSISETPFVYEKMGSRFKHFLLDEFQDTSTLQWNNLLPLVENTLADNNNVLTVGDVKQSIYRWRGADFRLLLYKLESDLKVFKETFRVNNLASNYRSAKEIVEFNNIFFITLTSIVKSKNGFKVLEDAYDRKNVIQEIVRKHKGYVQVDFIDEDEQQTNLQIPEAATYWKKNSLIKLYGTIQHLLQNGYKHGDITILVNRNKDGAMVAEFLFANGFDKIISSDSLLIKRAPQVIFVINVLRLLYQPNDNVSKAAAQWFVHRHICKKENDFSQFNAADFDLLFDKLKKYRNSTLTEMLYAVIKIFGLNKANDSYITTLLDLVNDFVSQNPNTLFSFLNWWDNERASNEKSVVISENENAIRVITIHKSKGLQFPVVIMPFFDWSMQPNKDGTMWVETNEEPFNKLGSIPVKTTSTLKETFFEKQWQLELENTYLENVNKIYVAFTRPEEQLYVFAPVQQNASGINRSSGCLKSAFDDSSFSKLFTATASAYTLGKIIQKEKVIADESSVGFENPLQVNATAVAEIFDSRKIGLKISRQSLIESDEIKFGLSLHEIMEQYFEPNDEEKVLTRIDKVNDARLFKQVQTAIQIVNANGWLAPAYEVYCERDLINNQKEILRPDRLMMSENKIIVLDYKTGSREESYKKQLQQYADVLLQMGYTQIEKYILYLETGELISV